MDNNNEKDCVLQIIQNEKDNVWSFSEHKVPSGPGVLEIKLHKNKNVNKTPYWSASCEGIQEFYIEAYSRELVKRHILPDITTLVEMIEQRYMWQETLDNLDIVFCDNEFGIDPTPEFFDKLESDVAGVIKNARSILAQPKVFKQFVSDELG